MNAAKRAASEAEWLKVKSAEIAKSAKEAPNVPEFLRKALAKLPLR